MKWRFGSANGEVQMAVPKSCEEGGCSNVDKTGADQPFNWL